MTSVKAKVFAVGAAIAAVVVVWELRSGFVDERRQSSVTSKPAPLNGFKRGQVWSYETRPTEENSRVTVMAVDQRPDLGEVIYVEIRGIDVGLPPDPHSGVQHTFAPFTRDALARSVRELVGETDAGSVFGFADGYEKWLAREGGAFTTSVRDALEMLDEQNASPSTELIRTFDSEDR